MTESTLRRRQFIVLAGAASAAGLAGCTSSGSNAQPDEQPTTTTTTEESSDDHHEAEEHHDDEETHSDGGHTFDGPQTHAEVTMESSDEGEHFHPHVAWVEVGGTVTFTNEHGAHSATAYHPDNDRPLRIPEGAASFDSGILSDEGATFEHTFQTEGVYDYYCLPHEQLGMIGAIIVGEPDPHDQPGLAAPQDGMSDTVAAKISHLNEQVNTMLGHEH